jgi:hypothetical protein
MHAFVYSTYGIEKIDENNFNPSEQNELDLYLPPIPAGMFAGKKNGKRWSPILDGKVSNQRVLNVL